MASNKMIVLFIVERETKGAVRYQEVDNEGKVLDMMDGAKVGTLYFRKTAFPQGAPKALKITVEG